jgi:hypothetical protein
MEDMVAGPQVKAASVNSWITADTWTAEISAALAQADDTVRASNKDVLAKLRAATAAPNFIHFIQTSWVDPSIELNRIAPDRPSLWKRGTFQIDFCLYEPGTTLARFK